MPNRQPDTWVTHTGHVKKDADADVLTAALTRINHVFDVVERPFVAFSGGKDSTCVMMLSLQVASERNRLPLDVALCDEEIIDPDTVDYLLEVSQWPQVNFHWLCAPLKHSLQGRKRTYWITWHPDHKDVWARQPPPNAIMIPPEVLPALPSYNDIMNYYLGTLGIKRGGAVLVGVRTAEAFNRLRALLTGGSWLLTRKSHFYAKPIYDWRTGDVWLAIIENEWPHSNFYNKCWKAGVPLSRQRVAVWGNVAARDNRLLPQFYPEFWQAAIKRLPELLTAARYEDSQLLHRKEKPPGLTWQEYVFKLIEEMPPDFQARWYLLMRRKLLNWNSASTLPFPEVDAVDVATDRPMIGSWQRMALVIAHNDSWGGSTRDAM